MCEFDLAVSVIIAIVVSGTRRLHFAAIAVDIFPASWCIRVNSCCTHGLSAIAAIMDPFASSAILLAVLIASAIVAIAGVSKYIFSALLNPSPPALSLDGNVKMF